ncbi:MAG: RluA family pseudouridine synthase [Oscillospiraceae bacterium]
MSDIRKVILIAEQENEGQRLDAFIISCLHDDEDESLQALSRTYIQRIIDDGSVTINNDAKQKSSKLLAGDTVCLTIPIPEEAAAEPQNIPIDIVYEDECLLVVNKSKGMVVHPAPGNYDNTLVNALLYHCGETLSGINGVLRPGIVHRIDKNTSGLLIVAKNDAAHRCLSEQISSHSFTREYEAIVYGLFKEQSGTLDFPIGRKENDRKKFCVTVKNSKSAVTHYEVLEKLNGFSHVRLRLETGRTHQIRVHMSHIGHPVAGDPIYGPKKTIESLGGQCLHAKKLGFIHPQSGQYMEFDSELPEYFTKFLDSVR